MDLATIGGILAALAVVGYAIALGGDFGQFIDIPSILIVFGGGTAAVLIRFSLGGVVAALGLGSKVAFMPKTPDPRELITKITELAEIVRKQGPLGLETVEIDDPVLARGMRYIADGYDPDFIRDAISKERENMLTRLSEGQRVFKAIGDAAPAFGMIGTLVGLVQMLGSMDDPSKIGPSMAIAILTTLYGALVANIIALPISEKLGSKLGEEDVHYTLVQDGVLLIRASKSPSVIQEMLLSYLPEHHREQFLIEA
ncbi:MAG: motility protein A [Labrys sp. (in: a-proteobacteria)]|jgi:chemotaxis protein MotA